MSIKDEDELKKNLFIKKALGQPKALVLASLVCFGAILLALVSQYKFDMQPCPWCILQRIIFALIGLTCLLLLPFRENLFRKALSILGLGLAVSGVASALWQYFQAANSNSCNLTLADKIVSKWTHLSEIFPFVFEVHASCSDAQASLLGIPYAFWSLALFVLLALFFAKFTGLTGLTGFHKKHRILFKA